MEKFSLDALVREHAELARQVPAGRSAVTIQGGHERVLRQTVIAMTQGTVLDEHENPGEATLQVLAGEVRLSAGSTSWDGAAGDLLRIPAARHELLAVVDCAVLLTVAVHTRAPVPPAGQ
ncbi:MAG: LuxR family transcriptional regulator [Candidatus Nanopelagicales bacterium]